MLSSLMRHPESQGGETLRMEVDASRPRPGVLSLRYVVIGDAGELRFPTPVEPERTDELWRHTCFEAFVLGAEGRYCEFNFAPTTQWAAYHFDAYRSGMARLDLGTPAIEGRPGGGRYELGATAVLDHLPDLPHDAPWRLALSAVLEGTDGRRSYWALAHPSGAPDFHHPDSFILSLDPTPAR